MKNVKLTATVLTLIALLSGCGERTAPVKEEPILEPVKAETEIRFVEVPVEVEEPVRYELTEEEREIIARVISREAPYETFDGQMAVAQCILNTCEARDMRPIEVVYEPLQYADPVAPENVVNGARYAVEAVFDDGATVTDEEIRFFYSPKYMENGYSAWHEESLEYCFTLGGHKFFKAKEVN